MILLLGLWFGLGGTIPSLHAPAHPHGNVLHQPANPSPALESERVSEIKPATGDQAAAAPSSSATQIRFIRRTLVQRSIAVTHPAIGAELDQRPPPIGSLDSLI